MRRREMGGWAPPAPAPLVRAGGPSPAPSWSLADIPAHSGSGKDRGHGSGCSCCAGKGSSKDEDSPFSVPFPTNAPAAAPAQATAPAPAPAVQIKKTITIFPVSVGSSSRDPYPDIAKANTVWNQCGVAIKSTIGQCWNSNVLDKLPPNDVLNEFSDAKNPTDEEKEMVQHQPGGSTALHAYYVPSLSAGSRGENIRKGNTPTLPEAVVVGDGAASDTLAHELGHILLADGTHHSDPDNLMASGSIRNVGVDKLDATQCGKI